MSRPNEGPEVEASAASLRANYALFRAPFDALADIWLAEAQKLRSVPLGPRVEAHADTLQMNAEGLRRVVDAMFPKQEASDS